MNRNTPGAADGPRAEAIDLDALAELVAAKLRPLLVKGPEPELLADTDVARLLNCSRRSVHSWTSSGQLPAPVKLAGATRWRRCEVLDAIEALETTRR